MEKVTLEQRYKGGEGGSYVSIWRKDFQTEGTAASAKSLGQKCLWGV